jgi:hypothetical protein
LIQYLAAFAAKLRLHLNQPHTIERRPPQRAAAPVRL